MTPGGAPGAPPSFGSLLFGSGPRFLRDAFGPTVVFYLGWKLHGLLLGVAAATVLTIVIYVWERRRERPGVAARIGLAIALVQAGAALISGSPIGYFAPPIVVSAVYGLTFLGSVVIGKPLVAVFAREAYPMRPEVRAHPAVQRTFARLSLAWGGYMLFRSAFRLVVLLTFSIDFYVLINVLTATPGTVGMLAWSFWYGLRGVRYADSQRSAP
ncbi:MAG TPA: VC0807 family protein [Terriglobales bacterium]|nr:VC0807 family protein [Terriglobales bacterium]